MNTAGQIEVALRAVRFRPQFSYSWFGENAPCLGGTKSRTMSRDGRRRWMVHQLQTQLYRDFYCPGAAVRAMRELNQTGSGPEPFVLQLSVANAGRGSLSDGWTVMDLHADTVIVTKGELKLWVTPHDCLRPRETSLEAGMSVALRFPKELLSISPGYYVACADKELVKREDEVLVRTYWNVTAKGAIVLMREVTSALNRGGVPFKLKVLNHPGQFHRCDAAVLYLHKADYLRVSSLLEEIYPIVAGHLKDSTPAMTKRLASGVGLAEDPGQGESYGSHRCGVLAESFVRIYELRKDSLEEKLAVVKACFEENGICWDTPFLTVSVADEYDFNLRTANAPRPVATSGPTPKSFLGSAMRAGQLLIRDAIWDDGRCNWIGVSNEGPSTGTSRSKEVGRPLGPDLYSGTSGIGLFLAQLHSVTGHSEPRRCSRGAILQALARAEHMKPSEDLGLYLGWPGVAVAAAMAARLLGEDDLLVQGTNLVRRMASSYDRAAESDFDLVSGKAGAITGLLVLYDLVGDQSFLEFAARLGGDLVSSASHTDAGYSWKAPAINRNRHALTGLAHGTAGAGFALIELFRVTGNVRYRDAAERAFDYERSWFNADGNNWPDFRLGEHDSKRSDAVSRFSTTWCHGAPGIAVSRLRAHNVLGSQRYKKEAIVALETTCETTRSWLSSGTFGHSLCHGGPGNADVLLQGWQVLRQDFAEGLAVAQQLAHSLDEALLHGARAGYTTSNDSGAPGLMLGTAGVGHFFLRLHDQSIPSMLSMAVSL